MSNRFIRDFREHASRGDVGERPVTILRTAEKEVSRGVEAETGHGRVVSAHHLRAGCTLRQPDADCGIRRRGEYNILERKKVKKKKLEFEIFNISTMTNHWVYMQQ